MNASQTLEEVGFFGPVRIFDEEACPAIVRRLRSSLTPLEWQKGNAAGSAAFFEVARTPAIVDRVAGILGEDVMVWGASLVERKPGQVHSWHTDIETSDPAGGTVSVWIGLENTDRRSSLQLVSRTHRLGMTIQERARQAGKPRGEVHAEDVLEWAGALDPESELIQPDVGNGEAIFFDGRLWHGSHNTNSGKTRLAILLQYARPERPIRIPDLSRLEYPFRFLEEPWPPCVMVRGSSRTENNRIVPAPIDLGVAESWVHSLELPLERNPETGWKPHGIHRGATGTLRSLGCHASVLDPGKSPHEPHAHEEEELLIVLDGEATLVIEGEEGDLREETLRPNAFVYYPAWQGHTIRNDSDRPVTYLMFKWRGDPRSDADDGGDLETRIHRFEAPEPAEGRSWTVAPIFSGPTRYLRKLHGHVSTLRPGGGYEPHVDAYDVAIVVLRGTVETLGRRVEPFGVIFYPAGKPHGMQNVGTGPASYLVFEFHGEASARPAPLVRRLWTRVPKRIRALVPRDLRQSVKRTLSARRGSR